MCVCEIIKGLAHWGKELGPLPLTNDAPFFFWPYGGACRDLSSGTRIEPVLPAVEAQSLNHWTAREFPIFHIFLIH